MSDEFPEIMTSQERLQGVLCMYDRIRELEGEAASLRAAGTELAELLGFIEYENDITAGPTEKARDAALSVWRKATKQ